MTDYYPWSRDKLIIGKFCQIAAGVEFVMNDANHQMNAVSGDRYWRGYVDWQGCKTAANADAL